MNECNRLSGRTPASYPENPKFHLQPGDSHLQFLSLPLVLPGKCWSSILIQTTVSASFPIHNLKSPSQLVLHNLHSWEEQEFTL